MKRRKFRSKTAADRFAGVTGHKAVRGASTRLKDGTKANWYSFKKLRGKKRR